MTTAAVLPARPRTAIRSLWFEITRHCQLFCGHCYASSGPDGDHGTMTTEDWLRLIDEAADMGVELVQFIGGEPSLHPSLPRLVDAALAHGLEAEVYTNLVHVSDRLWDLYCRPGVRLATSYYSDDQDEHAQIVGRPAAHRHTRSNIAKAVSREVPLRVSIIDLGHGQRVDEARAELAALGVAEIGYDRVRPFGRAAEAIDETDTCGNCGHGTAAIGPDGQVWACVFTRRVSIGSVLRGPLVEVLRSDAFHAEVARLDSIRRPQVTACSPPDVKCSPKSSCNPSCTPSCSPMRSSCKPTK